jgi:hypothetical protein
MRKTRFWGTPGMIGENFFIRSFILSPSASSSITKKVPEPVYMAKRESLFDKAQVPLYTTFDMAFHKLLA